jgi:hypothetical protein
MTGLNHALTGALVAATINRPAIALPAALLSHFATDAIPHWDYKLKPHIARRMVLMLADLTLSMALLLVLALTVDANPYLIIAGGLLGILPDTMWLRFFLTGRPSISGNPKRIINRLRQFHSWIQWSETAKGFFVELLWFPLMLWLIHRVHH